MKVVAGLALLLSLGSLGLSGWLWRENAELERRLAAAEIAASRGAEPAEATAASDLGTITTAVAERLRSSRAVSEASPAGALPEGSLRRLEEGLADLDQMALRVDAVELRAETAETATRTLETQLAAGRLPGGQSIADLVERQRAEQGMGVARDESGNAHKGKKRAFSELATALGLDGAQELVVRETLEASKKKAYELLLTTRADGGNFMDELADLFIEKGDAAEGEAQQLFMRSFSEPVPGTTTTFGAQILTLQAESRTEVRTHLRPDQTEAFDAMEVDFFDLETAYDPLRDHVMKRAAEQGAAPPR